VANARRLLENAGLREQMGRNGRLYAERAFDIDAIADRFAELLADARPKPAIRIAGEPVSEAAP
jgi:hypothetical protein